MMTYEGDGPTIRSSKSEVFAEANDAFSAIIIHSESSQSPGIAKLPLISTPKTHPLVLDTRPHFGIGPGFQPSMPVISICLSILGLFCLVFFMAIGALKLALQTQFSGALFSVTFLIVVFLFVARMLNGVFGTSEPFRLKLTRLLDLHLGQRPDSEEHKDHKHPDDNSRTR